MIRDLKAAAATHLRTFTSSSATFSVFRTVQAAKASPCNQTKSLYVLDASFNPPSKAHFRLASSAYLQDRGQPPKRLLMLYATQNAEKKSTIAGPEDRMVMMSLFASELLRDLAKHSDDVAIDVGITKLPYYHDKAISIDESGTYSHDTQQIHLLGFDSLARIFNAKYYPPEHKLRVLEPFLRQHRLRMTYRTDDKYGNKEEQDRYVNDIAEGKREAEGAKQVWAKQITLAEGYNHEEVVSSTLARTASIEDPDSLEKYLTPDVARYVREEKLYHDKE